MTEYFEINMTRDDYDSQAYFCFDGEEFVSPDDGNNEIYRKEADALAEFNSIDDGYLGNFCSGTYNLYLNKITDSGKIEEVATKIINI